MSNREDEIITFLQKRIEHTKNQLKTLQTDYPQSEYLQDVQRGRLDALMEVLAWILDPRTANTYTGGNLK